MTDLQMINRCDEAEDYFDAGRPDEAIRRLVPVLREDPEHVRATALLMSRAPDDVALAFCRDGTLPDTIAGHGVFGSIGGGEGEFIHHLD